MGTTSTNTAFWPFPSALDFHPFRPLCPFIPSSLPPHSTCFASFHVPVRSLLAKKRRLQQFARNRVSDIQTLKGRLSEARVQVRTLKDQVRDLQTQLKAAKEKEKAWGRGRGRGERSAEDEQKQLQRRLKKLKARAGNRPITADDVAMLDLMSDDDDDDEDEDAEGAGAAAGAGGAAGEGAGEEAGDAAIGVDLWIAELDEADDEVANELLEDIEVMPNVVIPTGTSTPGVFGDAPQLPPVDAAAPSPASFSPADVSPFQIPPTPNAAALAAASAAAAGSPAGAGAAASPAAGRTISPLLQQLLQRSSRPIATRTTKPQRSSAAPAPPTSLNRAPILPTIPRHASNSFLLAAASGQIPTPAAPPAPSPGNPPRAPGSAAAAPPGERSVGASLGVWDRIQQRRKRAREGLIGDPEEPGAQQRDGREGSDGREGLQQRQEAGGREGTLTRPSLGSGRPLAGLRKRRREGQVDPVFGSAGLRPRGRERDILFWFESTERRKMNRFQSRLEKRLLKVNLQRRAWRRGEQEGGEGDGGEGPDGEEEGTDGGGDEEEGGEGDVVEVGGGARGGGGEGYVTLLSSDDEGNEEDGGGE
ncbi:unnamed protein product [Closterium sp. NIES-53]